MEASSVATPSHASTLGKSMRYSHFVFHADISDKKRYTCSVREVYPLLKVNSLSFWERLTLLHLPNIVGLEKLGKVVVFLLLFYLFYLSVYGIIVSGGIDIADYTQSYGESVAVTHEGEL